MQVKIKQFIITPILIFAIVNHVFDGHNLSYTAGDAIVIAFLMRFSHKYDDFW